MYKYGIIETENRSGRANKDVVLTWLFEEDGTLSIFGAGVLPDYKEEQERPWQEYANEVRRVVIDDGITAIGARTFSGYEKLESLKLPGSMNRIGFRAFAGCTGLKRVEADKPFAHVYSTNVASASRGVLRADTIYIGMQSFANTPWIVETFGDFYIHRDVLVEYYGAGGSVEVPEGIREIGISAFEGSAVTSVKLPGSVKVVCAFAFNKTAISQIELPASVRKVERYAFAQTEKLESVLIGNENVELEEKAFWNSAVEEAVDPGKSGWVSVYHIESVREAGMDPCKRLEVRRDKKKLIGLTTLDCGKAIVKKLSSGGPVMRVRFNRENKTLEFVQSIIKDGRDAYTTELLYPVMQDGEIAVGGSTVNYLTKAEMESVGGEGLWPEEANASCAWYQATKGTAMSADTALNLAKAWLKKNRGYQLKTEA